MKNYAPFDLFSAPSFSCLCMPVCLYVCFCLSMSVCQSVCVCVVVDPSDSKCFGGVLSRFLLVELLGYDDVILYSLKQLAADRPNKGLSVSWSVCLSICMSIYLSVIVSVSLSLSVCLSVQCGSVVMHWLQSMKLLYVGPG